MQTETSSRLEFREKDQTTSIRRNSDSKREWLAQLAQPIIVGVDFARKTGTTTKTKKPSSTLLCTFETMSSLSATCALQEQQQNILGPSRYCRKAGPIFSKGVDRERTRSRKRKNRPIERKEKSERRNSRPRPPLSKKKKTQLFTTPCFKRPRPRRGTTPPARRLRRLRPLPRSLCPRRR